MQNIKKNIFLMLFILAFVVQLSCLDDSAETGGKGTLNVTVTTSTDIWNYPLFSDPVYQAFNGNTDGLWHYPSVGGTDETIDGGNLANELIPSTEVGDKINVVYLYSQLGDNSQSYPVVYKGTSSVRTGVITITDILPGTYYVIAFYDYCGGGAQTNILNRYDRYAIYTNTNALDGTVNSTPYMDRATSIEINNDNIEITLEIRGNWILGKPKTTSGGVGRIFLKEEDGIPVQ